MRAVFVLCEGIHDIAILGALLEHAGISRFTAKLDEYPPVIRGLLRGRYNQRPIGDAQFRGEDMPLMDVAPVFSAAYGNDNALFLFFTARGDKNSIRTREFLSDIVDLAGAKTPPDVRLAPFGLLFVRDANSIGISKRQEQLVSEFADSVRPILPSFSECSVTRCIRESDFSAGICIFSESGVDKGALEDLLKPVLSVHYAKRWEDAGTFIDKHATVETKLGKATPAKKLKARMTIAGQIDNPGSSQAVVLRELLNSGSILTELLKLPECNELGRIMLEVAQ